MYKRKILVINHAFGLSGSVISLGYMVRAFKKHDFQVFIVQKNSDAGANFLYECGAEVIATGISIGLSLSAATEENLLNPFGFAKFMKNFIKIPLGMLITMKYILKLKPSILYLNEFVLIQCSIIGKLLHIPTIMHVRGPLLDGTFGLRNILLRKSILFFNNKIIAITKTDSIQLFSKTQSVSFNEEQTFKNVTYIYEFINDSSKKKYTNSFKQQFNISANKKIIIMLGGVSEIKGTYEFIKAAKEVIKVTPHSYFIIAGKCAKIFLNKKDIKLNKIKNEYENRIFNFVNENNLWDYIRFLSEISDINELMNICDVLIFPSTISHFARPVIEAWSFNKPVILSETPHALEFVENGHDGILVSLKNNESLVKAINEILNDDELANRLGQNGYKKVLSIFNADNNLSRIVKICDSLC